ncbi:MDR family MFS transporter [Effusibacillus lacus]|uniref:MFS transporter n=1 Tax=Effusibacillus lacus TaxID=1348429 RepID=A0A292YRN7_9BACL|nr:MDR family MFS transporter [Effusibacillus lacus]TCS76299.1 EmrB/QacA subfamily drug resistance transporter [Effusibacillus lacus]GAX91846.1 MFS transporter [Effusibacillus lacus]
MKTNRKAVVLAVMLTNFLAAVDVTIVGTAMPTIVGKLGGLALISWVFSAYLLTSSVSTPIYGKLADLFGRKIMFTIGAAIFLIGSTLCGMAGSMLALVIGRAVQGLGAGAVMAIATTILGDLFTVEERGRIQGLFSGVWGFAAIVGPALGGLIIDWLSWPWVFYINLPIGLLGVLILWFSLHEQIDKKSHSIDYGGALTLTTSMTALLLVILQGAQWTWTNPATLALSSLALLGLIAFLMIERRAKEPIVPLELFKNKVIAISNATSFLVGAVLLGVTSYIPLYVQEVLGRTPTEAGFTLTPMSVAWMIGSVYGGRNMVTWGFRRLAYLGVAFITAGSVFLSMLTPESGRWFGMILMSILGLGLGMATLAFTVAIQSEVDWNRRGIATASNMFIRSLGSSIGVAIMGAVLNYRMAADNSLYSGLHDVFVWIGGISLAAVLIMALFPKYDSLQAKETRS